GRRKIRAEWSANLHGLHRAAGKAAAADIVHEFAEGNAKRSLKKSAEIEVAGELDRHGAARAANAEVLIESGAFIHDDRHGRERQHVVDDGRLAKQALVRRQRWFRAHNAAPAFEALQQRRLFTAHIRAGADAHLEIELDIRAGDSLAQHAGATGDIDGVGHYR